MENINKEEVEANRLKAYTGSRMEMIRGLWNNNLYTKTKFNILSGNYEELDADSLIITAPDSSKYIHWTKGLIITHPGRHFVGNMMSSVDYAYIGDNGFYTADLIWHGPISKQRMGDLLPYEYQPNVRRSKKSYIHN
jgi:hypothetical protein